MEKEEPCCPAAARLTVLRPSETRVSLARSSSAKVKEKNLKDTTLPSNTLETNWKHTILVYASATETGKNEKK